MSEFSTFEEVRAFIAKEAERLDPESRYIRELLAIVNQSSDLGDFALKLNDSRGAYWAGNAWARMTLGEKIRANLITNETRMMRFETWEIEALRNCVIPFLQDRSANRNVNILSLPCSHGEEAVSLASEFLDAGLSRFTITGYDIQGACIETARSGKIPISGLPRYVTAHVASEVMTRLWFFVGDVFSIPIGREPGTVPKYDFVVCRNFLGYFKYEAAKEILERLSAFMADESFLMIDTFVMNKYGGLMGEFNGVQIHVQGVPVPPPIFFRHKKGMAAVGRVSERDMR